MKRTVLTIGMLSLMVMGMATGACAATTRVTVPFAFYAGDVQVPAGEYLVELNAMGLTAPGSYIVLRNQNANILHAVMGMPSGVEDRGAYLVFNRYGDTYFLNQVRCASIKAQLGKSKVEKEMSLASVKDKAVQIQIAVAR